MFQIVTGSSSVFIGGARAARAGIDITMHCFNAPAPRILIKLGKLAAIANKVSKAAGKAANVANKATQFAQAAQVATAFCRS
jgi:hypothetical protein